MGLLIWSVQSCTGQQGGTYRTKQDLSDSDLSFEEVVVGSGETSDGARMFFYEHRASDGVLVTLVVEKRKAASEAAKALEEKTKKASRIIETVPIEDESGNVIGSRVVAFAPGFITPGKSVARIYELEGSRLQYIESDSLGHALAFERWLGRPQK